MRLGGFRDLFSRERSFRGANIELARKFAKAVWPAGALIAWALIPFYPPTARLGNAGWVVAGVDVALTAAWIYYLCRWNDRVTFNTLLFSCYAAVLNVGLSQWLAGGLPAPFHELYPFGIVASAAIIPPRRFPPYVLTMLAVAILPELGHASAGQIGDLVTELVLWTGTSTIILAVMFRIRQHRVELQESQSEAQELARVDPLTGLGNRRAFEESLAAEIARARRSETPLSLLVCDLNNFKKINDAYGHLAGDDCLRQVADALRSELRGTDVCFRWGGDEFVVLLAGAGEQAALDVAARLEDVVPRSCARPDESPLYITSGHATLVDWMSGQDLLGEADRQLLARKERVSAPPAS